MSRPHNQHSGRSDSRAFPLLGGELSIVRQHRMLLPPTARQAPPQRPHDRLEPVKEAGPYLNIMDGCP